MSDFAKKCNSCGGDGFAHSFNIGDCFNDIIDRNTKCFMCKGTGLDTSFKDDIYCPYCGYKHDPHEVEIFDDCKGVECYHCEKEFEVTTDRTIDYSTYKREVF